MPWYRVWTDILDSEKFAELDDATIGGWTLILSAVKRNDAGGYLPPIKRLAHWTRRTTNTVAGWTKELVRVGLLEETPEGVRVHDWDHWQEPKDRTNAARQAKFKAKHRNSPSGLPLPEAEQTQRESRQDKTVIAMPLPDGDNGPVTPLPRSLPSSTSLRSGEDAIHYEAALKLLDDSQQTEPVAMEFRRRASLPEIKSTAGWQWLNAARVMCKGGKACTFAMLFAIARGSTREEFEAYSKAPAGKNGKPGPGPTNQPLPRVDHATPEAKAKHEECVAKYKELESRNGRLPAV